MTDIPTTELTLSACRALGGGAGPSAVLVARSSVDDGMTDVKFAPSQVYQHEHLSLSRFSPGCKGEPIPNDLAETSRGDMRTHQRLGEVRLKEGLGCEVRKAGVALRFT